VFGRKSHSRVFADNSPHSVHTFPIGFLPSLTRGSQLAENIDGASGLKAHGKQEITSRKSLF
jgi:hypothetical protein